jgi:hypothetical protein
MEINTELLTVVGILSDEEKFKILAAVALGANTPDKISRLTGFDSSKIIKAVVRLEQVGLVENQADAGYLYCVQKLKDLNHYLNKSLAHKPTPTGIDRFIRNGRLQVFPKSRDDRLLVLQYLANLFEFDKQYPEIEVNIKLTALHPDFAALRRYLIDYGFFERNNVTVDGRTIVFYRRIPGSSVKKQIITNSSGCPKIGLQ